jgi:hypothetical protein
MNIPYDLLTRWINEDQGFIDYVKANYSYEYEYYLRFRKSSGPDCPIARAALKRIFTCELGANKQQLLASIDSGSFRAQ